jgi:hypothetical protein
MAQTAQDGADAGSCSKGASDPRARQASGCVATWRTLRGVRFAAMLATQGERTRMKPRDFIQVLENPGAKALSQQTPEAELLLTLVAKLFYADKVLDDRELALVTRLADGVADVRGYVEKLAAREFDYEKLAATFPDSKDRDDIVTLAEHAVWGDDEVDSREWDIVDKLVEVLGIDRP